MPNRSAHFYQKHAKLARSLGQGPRGPPVYRRSLRCIRLGERGALPESCDSEPPTYTSNQELMPLVIHLYSSSTTYRTYITDSALLDSEHKTIISIRIDLMSVSCLDVRYLLSHNCSNVTINTIACVTAMCHHQFVAAFRRRVKHVMDALNVKCSGLNQSPIYHTPSSK